MSPSSTKTRTAVRGRYRPLLEWLERRLAPAAQDTLLTATHLSFDANNNTAVGSTLADPNQVDLYAVSLSAGDEVAATLAAAAGSNLAGCLRVFDPAGMQIAFEEDATAAANPLTFDALADGKYYVGISSDGDYAYDPAASGSGKDGATAGDYTLALADSPGAILTQQQPPDDNFTDAQRISGNADASITGQGVLAGTYAGAAAYFRLTADQTGGLAATVTPADPAGPLAPRLILYSDRGKLLIQSDAAAPGAVATLSQVLEPGTYFLAVTAAGAAPTTPADYTLATNFTSSTPPAQPMTVGAYPEGIAAGDFNHDGHLDVVTANYDAGGKTNTISMLLGNGDGTFQANNDLSVNDGKHGVGPASVAVGDLNGDGNLDVVTGNFLDNTVSVLLGNGDGTFQKPVTYLVGSHPIDVVLADLRGDGTLDIVAADSAFDPATGTYGPGMVSVLLGKGDGTFAPAVAYAVGTDPAGVAVADVTGDGIPDVVTANAVANTVSVLPGKGDGGFGPAITLATGARPIDVAVGTFGGHAGIVTADRDAAEVSLILARGGGTFAPAVAEPVGVQPVAVRTAVVGGQTAVITANRYANSVSVLLARQDGTLGPATTYGAGYQPYAVAVGDFNGDGIADLAVADFTDADVRILAGRGDGTFLSAARFATGQTPFGMVAGDFNGDFNLDLATADGGDNTVAVLRGNGDGTFAAPQLFDVGRNPVALAESDFNGDGRLDLVTANYVDGTVSVLLGRGDGTFLPAVSYPVGRHPRAVAVGDLAGNGVYDIVVANYDDNDVAVLWGNGDGTFRPAVTYATDANPYSVAIATIAGRPTIVTANTANRTVSVLRENADHTFAAPVNYAVAPVPQAVAVATLAGRTAILTADSGYNATTQGYDSGSVSVLLGNPDGTFAPAVNYTVGTEPNALAVGDFLGNGRLDVVASSFIDSTVSVLVANADGTFQPAVTTATGDTPHAIVADDFNKDGKLDVVTANLGDNSVSVLLGTGLGPFQAPATYPVSPAPAAVAVNGDRNSNDVIVTADASDNAVRVLLGNADGTAFQPASRYPLADHPDALTTFSQADGDVSIATANAADGSVTVLPGNPADSFGTPAVYPAGDHPTAIATGGDAHNNVVIFTADAAADTVTVLVGNPGGTQFQLAGTYTLADRPVALTTFSGSGQTLDFAVACAGGTVAVFLGDANDHFTLSNTYAVGPDPVAIAVGYDASYKDVLATVNAGDDTASVLVGNVDGTLFQPAVAYPVGPDPASIAIGNDANDNLDLVVADRGNNTVAVLRGDSNDSFGPAAEFPVGDRPTAIDIINDNNGSNGNLDVVTANAGAGTVSVLLGNTPLRPSTPQNGVAVRHVPYLADLTGDGVPDAAILKSNGEIIVRRGLSGPSGGFAPPVVVNPGRPARDMTLYQAPGGWAIAAVDAQGNTVETYRWDLFGQTFVATGSFATGTLPTRVAAADLTGDGLDDLVVASNFDHTVTIALQAPDGSFAAPLTRAVGAAPSDFAFADLTGSGRLDIVVSDQASGDVSILFNDGAPATPPTFATQSRYRAGAGLFDIDTSTGQETVLSQLETVGVVAGDFTGTGRSDLVVLDRGTGTLGLIRNLGDGRFTDGVAAGAPVRGRPGQVVALTLPGDALPSVAVLVPDLAQVWFYRNRGDGTFAAPAVFSAGLAPDGLSVVTAADGTAQALLVGNGFGDVLTLRYDGHGGFTTDRAGLDNVPLAVGALADGRQFAVVASQGLDQMSVWFRDPHTGRFNAPAPIDSGAQPLLAPGAVQMFFAPGDAEPYLAVANSLSNNVLVYHGTGPGQFGPPTSYAVGFDPVAITVAFVNGDNVPDLLVANRGSDDVSVLIGSETAAGWTATPYQRLSSGGSGPIALALRDSGTARGPDLVVTNSDGRVVVLPGIGSGGNGSGFFQDANPQTIDLGDTIRQAIGGPGGALFVLGNDGAVSALSGDAFTTVIKDGVATLGAFGSLLLAGFDNGTVGALTADGALLSLGATGFTDQPSAVAALESGGQLDVFATQQGSDVPVAVTLNPFISTVGAGGPSVESAPPVSLTIPTPQTALVLVTALVSGGLVEGAPGAASAEVPADSVFALLAPGAPTQVAADEEAVAVIIATYPALAAPAGTAGTAGTVGTGGTPGPSWEAFPLGVDEAIRRLLKRQAPDDADLPAAPMPPPERPPAPGSSRAPADVPSPHAFVPPPEEPAEAPPSRVAPPRAEPPPWTVEVPHPAAVPVSAADWELGLALCLVQLGAGIVAPEEDTLSTRGRPSGEQARRRNEGRAAGTPFASKPE